VNIADIMVSEHAQLFDALANIGMGLYARGLDREDEYQADRVGVVLATRAGYDPTGFPRSLRHWQASAPTSTVGFLQHPSRDHERIQLLDQKMGVALDGRIGLDVAERFLRHQAAVVP